MKYSLLFLVITIFYLLYQYQCIDNPNIKIKLEPEAIMPKRTSINLDNFEVFSKEDVEVPYFGRVTIKTGVRIENISKNYFFEFERVYFRLNYYGYYDKPGTFQIIDSDFHDEISISVSRGTFYPGKMVFPKGHYVGTLKLKKIHTIDFIEEPIEISN